MTYLRLAVLRMGSLDLLSCPTGGSQGGFTVQALSVTWLPGLQVENIIMGAAALIITIIYIIIIITRP